MKIKQWFRSRTARVALAGGMTLGMVGVVMAPSAGADTGTWYTLKKFKGATGVVRIDSADHDSAAGWIGVRNPKGRLLYVQVKPIEGGLWKRAMKNVPRDIDIAWYQWSDNHTLGNSGYLFRICQDDAFRDTCGKARKVTTPGTLTTVGNGGGGGVIASDPSA